LRKVVLHAQLQPGLWIDGDPAALRQALWNLIRNAWEAMADGGPMWLELQIEVAEGGRRSAEISVEDGGQGVAEAIAQDIFAPFFTSKPSGTGMGLAVVQQIARHHRGQVLLRPPRHGQGARFALVLPLSHPNSEVAPPTQTERTVDQGDDHSNLA
jgi:signal transduction histidine kinase